MNLPINVKRRIFILFSHYKISETQFMLFNHLRSFLSFRGPNGSDHTLMPENEEIEMNHKYGIIIILNAGINSDKNGIEM